MATIKNTADLTTDANTNIGSQTAPDAITPAVANTLLEDLLVSYWNKLDGIKCQFPSIPDEFTGIVAAGTVGDTSTGDTLNDILFNIMEHLDARLAAMDEATQDVLESVQGGVQGKVNEFLAMIVADTTPNINMVNATTATVYQRAAVIQLVNDKDNGGFDNGNNWLVKRQIVPAGVTSSKYYASNLEVTLIEETIVVGGQLDMKFRIMKNGTVEIESSDVQSIEASDSPGTKYYFDDFFTSNFATVAPTDVITLELWYTRADSNSAAARVEITKGVLFNELP